MDLRLRVVALLGATASGKARLALEAARRAGAEILSCDSMKVYRGLDVGTAKPDAATRSAVRWHGLDLVEPHERFDVATWVKVAEDALTSARDRRVPVLVEGGTVLYLKALTEGLFEGAPRDAVARARIRSEIEAQGSASLHARLAELDPDAGRRIHPNDARRIERALEVHAATGRPISDLQSHFGRLRAGVTRRVFAIAHRREDLDRRINRRVDRMVAAGWLEEVRELARRAISVEAEQALGYRELLAHVRSGEKEPLSPLIETIKTKTRRFARRQLNWLRHHVEGIEILDVPPGAEAHERHLDTVVAALRESVGEPA